MDLGLIVSSKFDPWLCDSNLFYSLREFLVYGPVLVSQMSKKRLLSLVLAYLKYLFKILISHSW